MKKTVNVNIGSVGYTIDEDAYQLLKGYLEAINSRMNAADAKELMEDIESRIADIFNQNISFSNQVVNTDLVRRVMGTIGSATDFDDPQTKQATSEPEPQTNTTRKLYRARSERVIAGVCGGIAQFLNVDVTIVRVIAFILLVFGGASLWIYIIMWIIIPQKPIQINYFNYTDNEYRQH